MLTRRPYGITGRVFLRMMGLESEPETAKETACRNLLQHTLHHLLPSDEVGDYLEGAAAALKIGQSPALINDSLRIVGEIAEKWAPATILGSHCEHVVPLVIKFLGQRISVEMASYAMEKYWLAVPAKVEAVVLREGLTASSNVVDQCLKWYLRMIPDLSLDAALTLIVGLLLGDLAEVKLSAIQLLGKYSRLGNTQKNVLRVKLLSSSIPPETCAAILQHKTPPRTKAPVKVDSEKIPPSGKATSTSDSSSYLGMSPSLTIALANVKYTPEELEGLEINNYQLNSQLEEMRSCFAGKETEQNWRLRDNLIHMMRQWLRGPKAQQPTVVDIVIKNIEGICKSVKSNRTTLSTQGCQLVKDVVILDTPVADEFATKVIPTFQELCSSTKLITHTNANMVLVVFCLKLTSPTAVARIIRHGANLKNDQPRLYALLWLQIYIDKFKRAPDFDAQFVSEIILKLVSDINPKVRQAARNAFLSFEEVRADLAGELFRKIPSNYAKAIRTQGHTLAASSRPGSAQGYRSLSSGRPSENIRRVSHLEVDKALEPQSRRTSSRLGREATSRKPADFHRTTSAPEVPLSTKPLPLLKTKASPSLLFDQHSSTASEKVSLPPVVPMPLKGLPFFNPPTPSEKSTNNVSAVEVNHEETLEALLTLGQSSKVLLGVQSLIQKFNNDENLNDMGTNLGRAIYQALLKFPVLLFPLLRQHPRKLAAVIPISTFIRLMCVLEYILDEYIAIMKNSGQDVVLHALIELMRWCDLPSIAPDPELTTHIIDHKNTLIIPLLIRLLRALVPEYIPPGGEYGNIVSQLFSMILTIDDPWDANIVDLLQELQKINAPRFDVELCALGDSRKFIEKLLRGERPVTIESNEEDFVMSPVKVASATSRPTLPKPSLSTSQRIEPEAPQLVKDFAEVLLSEDLLRHIIQQADPLEKKVQRSKQIEIFNDPPEQKKQDTEVEREDRWFTLMMTRFLDLCNISEAFVEQELDIPDILNAILLLGSGDIDEKGVGLILNALSDCPEAKYPDVDLALWNFFKFAPASRRPWGLVILRQLLINNYVLDLQQLWQSLSSLIDLSDSYEEVHVALDELGDNIFDGTNDVQQIIGLIFDSLADLPNLLTLNVLFQTSMLKKALLLPSPSEVVTADFVERLDYCLRHYLNDEASELRQASVSVYSQLMRVRNCELQTANVITKVINELPNNQRELIRYYSRDEVL